MPFDLLSGIYMLGRFCSKSKQKARSRIEVHVHAMLYGAER